MRLVAHSGHVFMGDCEAVYLCFLAHEVRHLFCPIVPLLCDAL